MVFLFGAQRLALTWRRYNINNRAASMDSVTIEGSQCQQYRSLADLTAPKRSRPLSATTGHSSPTSAGAKAIAEAVGIIRLLCIAQNPLISLLDTFPAINARREVGRAGDREISLSSPRNLMTPGFFAAGHAPGVANPRPGSRDLVDRAIKGDVGAFKEICD